MKFELYDKEKQYSEIIEYEIDEVSLQHFIRLVSKPSSAKKVLKAILDKKEWRRIKKLKLPKDSYERVIKSIADNVIFPELERLARLSKEFKAKYIEFMTLYGEDKRKYDDLVEEYIDD